MSRLDALIQTLCPNGVRYCELKELANIGTGNSNRIDACDGGEYPFFVRSKQVMRSCKFDFDEEAIIIPGEGGIGEIFHYIQGKYDLHQRAYRISFRNQDVNTKFAYYYMLANFKKHIMLKAVTATVISIRRPMIDSFRLAVPPLPVQEEIVRILDTFTNVVEELETELEAEQAARTKQYDHYRNELLAFEKPVTQSLTERRVRWVTLGEIATVLRGTRLTKSQLSPDAIYPVFHGGLEPLGYYGESNRPAETVMVINVGASVGTVGYSKVDFWSSDGCFCVKCSDEVIGRYMYYALVCQQNYLRSRARFAGIPTLDNVVVEKIEIPLPSLEEQARIIKTLDLFDTLVNDLKSGLPAEIILRRKQYEYYRNKLLTFEPKQPPL